MHRYLRSIGFSSISAIAEEEALIADVLKTYDIKNVVEDEDHQLYVQISKEYSPDIGVSVCGYYDEENLFHLEQYSPYIIGSQTTTCQQIAIEPNSSGVSYLGACDDVRVGTTLIFHLLNVCDYMNVRRAETPNETQTSLSLSGLSPKGKILLPLSRKQDPGPSDERYLRERDSLYNAAAQGNEEAIESLTREDIDAYTMIARRIQHEDVYTIVDSYFMPYGLESNLYNLMGDITECTLVRNAVSDEPVWKLSIRSNGIPLDVCINGEDLEGEPLTGRRFKGVVWLQGTVNF